MKAPIFLLLFFLFVGSCSQIEFVLKDGDKSNPLFKNTGVVVYGEKAQLLKEYTPIYFENPSNYKNELRITVSETKTMKLIEKNQVASKTDYEILMRYSLSNVSKKCTINNQEIYSNFSFIPKSSGYNFGSDKSLDSLYENAFKKNMAKFINNLPGDINERDCLNEN